MFVIQTRAHGEPGSRHKTREAALAAIEDLVRRGLAEPGQHKVVELDERGDVVGRPFGLPLVGQPAARGTV